MGDWEEEGVGVGSQVARSGVQEAGVLSFDLLPVLERTDLKSCC